MSCVSSSRAKHTILKGCCSTGNNCCDRRSAYSATKYCDCDPDVSRNQEISYENDLCALLGTGFTGQTYTGLTGITDFYAKLNNLDYTPFNCGTFPLYVVTSGITGILVGTVFNTDITTTGTDITPTGPYDIVINAGSVHSCGTFVRA